MVVADGKTYISLVWHDDEPSEEREINALILRKLGYRNLSLPESVISKMEKARESLSPRLRGRKLTEWSEKWVAENLSAEQAERNGSWIVSRFKRAVRPSHSRTCGAWHRRAINDLRMTPRCGTGWRPSRSAA